MARLTTKPLAKVGQEFRSVSSLTFKTRRSVFQVCSGGDVSIRIAPIQDIPVGLEFSLALSSFIALGWSHVLES